MHAAAVLSEDGLGHEGCIHAVLGGYLLDDQPIGHGAVGHGKSIRIAQIYLMLAGRDLMMAVFHLDAHLLKGQDGLAP